MEACLSSREWVPAPINEPLIHSWVLVCLIIEWPLNLGVVKKSAVFKLTNRPKQPGEAGHHLHTLTHIPHGFVHMPDK